ncbi:hypothetical protein NK356_10715 [Chryseobacterium sp. S0630]|uniref:hypothetical protein n=1 Tax=Chryseobacterium sp. S0630 TaxID=2957803 RepID=UPI0020A1828F|nr:hypothetical protein [Chryseobacterium sp. S0630]MCP1299640.1 hypothetical protein [Chryseobacterium sp. S0630]
MVQSENEKLDGHYKNIKKNSSHTKQTDMHENTDFINENAKTDSSQIEKPKKGRGLRFLDSIAENGSFIKKALKSTGIGLAVGLGLALLFPPLGIAVMAISAIAGVAAIGGKVAYSYAKSNAESRKNNEITEPKAEILREIVKELMEEKLSNNKEETQTQEKKNSSKEDLKQNSETDNRREIRKSVIKNTNKSGLAMFTKPLNSPNPNIKQDASPSKSKVQQKEAQTASRSTGLRRNTL